MRYFIESGQNVWQLGWKQFVHEQMKNVSGDPSHYSSSDLATVDHIRDEAKKLYTLYISQKVKFILYLSNSLRSTKNVFIN